MNKSLYHEVWTIVESDSSRSELEIATDPETPEGELDKLLSGTATSSKVKDKIYLNPNVSSDNIIKYWTNAKSNLIDITKNPSFDLWLAFDDSFLMKLWDKLKASRSDFENLPRQLFKDILTILPSKTWPVNGVFHAFGQTSKEVDTLANGMWEKFIDDPQDYKNVGPDNSILHVIRFSAPSKRKHWIEKIFNYVFSDTGTVLNKLSVHLFNYLWSTPFYKSGIISREEIDKVGTKVYEFLSVQTTANRKAINSDLRDSMKEFFKSFWKGETRKKYLSVL